MYIPALMRLALGMGALMVVLLALIAYGESGAAEKKATPDSPIVSEPGWMAYQTARGASTECT
jgi:hypothetical protein